MNKNVIITGASSDIGLAISEVFAKANYNLILTYNTNKIVLDELKSRYSNIDIAIYHLDLDNEDEINVFVDEVISKYKKIDVLVNNAAFTLDCDILDKTKANFMKILSINVVGTFLLSRAIANNMKENKYGKIINISSTNGIDTMYPEGLDYDVSKAGIINLTHNLAKAYAPYVNVNALALGWIDTKINNDLDCKFKENEINKILLKRFGLADEVANVVYFLASDSARYINSTVIRVDGGIR